VTFDVRTDRQYIRASGGSDRFVLVRFTAPESRTSGPRPPLNVAFVLDRSGSMAGQKIALAKDAVERSIALLKPTDRFSIVVYDEIIDVVFESAPASAEAKRNARERLQKIDARGSTDLGAGWLRGCEQVAARLDDRQLTRVMRLSDGLANRGITDPAELQRHAGELRARGVITSTFGVGADFDEALLHGMANAGGGHFYFIETARQIVDMITSELQETIEVVARDVALEVVAPEGVLIEPLSESSREQRGSGWRLGLGDVVTEQEVTAVFRVNFPAGALGTAAVVSVGLGDRDGDLREPPVDIAFEYADHPTNDAQRRDRDVDRQVAQLYAARARYEAVALNRAGTYDAARDVLLRVADRIAGYAGTDRVLRGTVEALRAEASEFGRDMVELDRKRAYFASAMMSSMRAPGGKARRKSS